MDVHSKHRQKDRRNRRRERYKRSILVVDGKSTIVNFSIDYSVDISDHDNSVQSYNFIKCKARPLHMSRNNHTKCNRCKTNQVEIIQESGEFYLNCWQERTYPNV
jgi:hypothetical protein